MKTQLTIEIETPDKVIVFPEEGQSDDDFEGKEKQKELDDFRKEYSDDLHQHVINYIKSYLSDRLEEQMIDDMDDLAIEQYETFEDYGIRINVVK